MGWRQSLPDGGVPVATSIALPVAAPFNLQVTVRLLQRRPTNLVDRWQDGHYRRVLAMSAGDRLCQVVNRGTVERPDIWLDILGGAVSAGDAAMATATIRWMLGLDAPPAPISWLVEKEPRFGPVASAMDGFRTPCFPSLFETCASVLPFQQLSIDAGVAILGRVVEAFGRQVVIDDQAWFVFPTPEAIASADPAALRQTGLSAPKVAALQALAGLASAGAFDAAALRAMPAPQALAALRALPGIGPWSAGLVLLRGLRRLDIFPAGDVGAARNLTALFGAPEPFTPASTCAFADRFGDRKGYLYFLALGGQLQARGLLEADEDGC